MARQIALIRTNAKLPPRSLCVVRDNWVSKPRNLSTVVGVESKVVGSRFMDRQYEFLRETIQSNDEITLPSPTNSSESFPHIKGPILDRNVRHEERLQVSINPNCVTRIKHLSLEEKGRQIIIESSADFVKSPFSLQFNQELEATIPDHPCKKLRRDVS
jgi:hypothetical protein